MRGFVYKLVFCLLVTTMLMCGCSKKDTRTVVEFASWGSKSEINIIKPILADFEKENPDIKVRFLHIPQNYFQKIHLLYASNTPPDVIFVNNLNLPIYANAGVLEPIGDWADKSVFYDKALSSLSWNNKLYAVPRDISTLVIYYNKDLFDKFGLKYPRKDWDFKEFINISEQIKKHNVFAISFEENHFFFLPYLMSEGGGIVSDDLSKIIIDEPQSQNGLNFYADLRKKYHVAPKAEESASATMAQLFLQEKLAMHLSGRWLVPKYREDAKFNWDVVTFPRGSVGSITPLDASGWAVSKNSKHKQEAYKLINYLSSYGSIAKITQCGLIVPARKDVATSKYFLDGNPPKNSRIFLDSIETSKPTPVPVNYKEITDNLQTKFEKLFR